MLAGIEVRRNLSVVWWRSDWQVSGKLETSTPEPLTTPRLVK